MSDDVHPEEAAVVRWMRGRTVEIGAGSHPTPGVDVTVDHTPAGVAGTAGCENGEVSVAMVCADMTALPFPDNDFDTLIARHVLEHHPDTLAVLRAWWRVAKRLVIICPDQETYPGNTVMLDSTHAACFTRRQLARLVLEAAGDSDADAAVATAVPNWSFLLVADRP